MGHPARSSRRPPRGHQLRPNHVHQPPSLSPGARPRLGPFLTARRRFVNRMALMANRSHARRAPWLDMLKTGGHSNGSTTSPAPTTKVVTQVVARKLRRGKVWPSESWFPLQITTFELIPACGAKIPRTKMAYETHSLHYLHCQLNIHVIIRKTPSPPRPAKG